MFKGDKHVWFKRKKLTFEKAAKFNYELDSNEKLRIDLKNLALNSRNMSKSKYLSEMLLLFNNAGFDISIKELDMLLLLRQKTDQLLLKETVNEKTESDLL